MNFINHSIFKRNTEETPELQPDSAGVLAVWGSPGCGKTTVAVKLAKQLAQHKKNVILLLCDMTVPMLPCIYHPPEEQGKKSLGSVLAAPCVSEALVKYNLLTLKDNGYLAILGMRMGENEYTYPPYTEEQAKQLFSCLRSISPYVIVDCGSHIANDVLSAVALMEADSVLRLTNCNCKAASFFSGQLPLLESGKWDADKQYLIASDVKPNQPINQISGNVFTLSHSQELEQQFLEGKLLSDLGLKDSLGFRKELKSICKEVFGI